MGNEKMVRLALVAAADKCYLPGERGYNAGAFWAEASMFIAQRVVVPNDQRVCFERLYYESRGWAGNVRLIVEAERAS